MTAFTKWYTAPGNTHQPKILAEWNQTCTGKNWCLWQAFNFEAFPFATRCSVGAQPVCQNAQKHSEWERKSKGVVLLHVADCYDRIEQLIFTQSAFILSYYFATGNLPLSVNRVSAVVLSLGGLAQFQHSSLTHAFACYLAFKKAKPQNSLACAGLYFSMYVTVYQWLLHEVVCACCLQYPLWTQTCECFTPAWVLILIEGRNLWEIQGIFILIYYC